MNDLWKQAVDRAEGTVERIKEGAAKGQLVETEPTEAQKEAENYRKAHVTLDGLNIAIENPIGSTRSGTDDDGNKWSQRLRQHVPNLDELQPAAQIALKDMNYNIKLTSFPKFVNMLRAPKTKDYSTAADEVVDSKYYRKQPTGTQRATRNAQLLRAAGRAKAAKDAETPVKPAAPVKMAPEPVKPPVPTMPKTATETIKAGNAKGVTMLLALALQSRGVRW